MIRHAKIADAETLTQISFESKGYWNDPREYFVIWSTELTIADSDIENNDVFVFEEHGVIIGYYSLVELDDKVLCETPTPGKKPTRIDKWKYVAIRRAILKSIPKDGEGLLFKDLAKHVQDHLSSDELMHLGSVSWYTTTVKLDLEVCGEIKRVEKTHPQRLLKR